MTVGEIGKPDEELLGKGGKTLHPVPELRGLLLVSLRR